jgi:bacillithiol biosynthesis cysteine-adding enzyme BshC
MEPACIRHTELPGTTKLFADYSYHFDRVARFYSHDPHDRQCLEAAARQIQYPDDRRVAVAKALAAQNGGNPLLAQFEKPGTAAIVTGQQVGLFSGPAYTIYKALTAARLAEDLSSRGVPAVPVFWLASEDHDFAEVNHAWLFDHSRRPVRVETAALEGRPRPVGTIEIAKFPVDDVRAALRGFPHGEEVAEAVAHAYRPGASMGAAFRQLLITLLGKLGVLTIDPLDPAIRAIGAPFMASALRAAPELKAGLLQNSRELLNAGYHAQVLVGPNTSIFFLLENGERQPLRRKDSELASLCDRAADVSPNALLRPVWQDYLLPTAGYVGGPAELAYLAQSRFLYECLLGRMPVMISRAGFTLLDLRAAKLLDRYRLAAGDVLVQGELLKERIARTLIPEPLERHYAEASAEIGARLDKLSAETAQFDPTLGAALAKSRAKVLYQLNKMRLKTERESLRRDAQATLDAHYLSDLLFPHRHLQERFYSILPFMAQHGMDLAGRLYTTLDRNCPDHRILAL